MHLTPVVTANEQDNIILVTELLFQNKSDTIAFLYGECPLPPRFARIPGRQN